MILSGAKGPARAVCAVPAVLALWPAAALADEVCLAVTLSGPSVAVEGPALAARLAPWGGAVVSVAAPDADMADTAQPEVAVMLPPDFPWHDGQALLLRPGRLSFHAVLGSDGSIDPEGALIDAPGVLGAEMRIDQTGPALFLALDADGAYALAQVTSDLLGDTLAIALDGEVIMAPRVMEAIPGGQLIVSGRFGAAELGQMAAMIASPLSSPLTLKTVAEAECPASDAADAN